MVYETMIDEAAAKLAAEMRRGNLEVHVWAVATTADRDGRLHVGSNPPEEMAPVVRPSDNGASAHHRWAVVPYSALRQILWTAARVHPILPLERGQA
jgi:hypothetical protein